MKKPSLFLLCLSSLVLISCNDTSSESSSGVSSSEPTITKFEISNKVVELEMFESFQLSVSSTIEGNITWSSDNPNVASVSSDGLVKAISIGEATISAVNGSHSQTCKISVSNISSAPTLSLSENNIELDKGASYSIETSVFYKDSETDGTFSVVLSKGAKEGVASASVNGNKITIEGLTYGRTSFVVVASSCGLEVNKTLEVNVTTGYQIKLSNLAPSYGVYSCSLATFEIEDGLKSELDLGVGVYDGDKKIDTPLTYTFSKDGVAEASNGLVKAIGIGKTKLEIASLEYSVYLEVNIEVSRPTLVLKDAIDIEIVDPVVEIPFLRDANVTGAFIDNGANVLSSFEDGVLTLDKTKLPKKGSELGEGKTLRISSDNVDCSVSINLYSQIINDFDELVDWQNFASSQGEKKGIYEGYYILGNDIDASNKPFYPPMNAATMGPVWADAPMGTYDTNTFGFMGIFDGKGHNINGLSQTSSAGFIYMLGKTGVIQNISFTNMVNNYSGSAGLVTFGSSGTYRNVYASVSKLGSGKNQWGGPTGVFASGNCFASTRFNNCIADFSNCEDKPNKDRGAYGFSIPLGMGVAHGAYVIGVDKENGFYPSDDSGKGGDVYDSFLTYKDMKDASIDYSSWDESFWDTSSGVPTPKNGSAGEISLD